AAGALATGERDGFDGGVFDERLGAVVGNQDGGEDAVGEAGAGEEVFDGQGAAGDVGGVLEDGDVAGHQRGCGEAEDLPEGKVPGHDGQDRAEGFVADVGAAGVGGNDLGAEEGL